MSLRFVLDEQMRGGGLWQAIQQHNASGGYPLDIVRVGDPFAPLLGTPDPDLLLWAEREGRILLSRDYNTMPGHFAHHLRVGRHSPGLILILPRRSLADVLASLVLVTACGNPIDFQDRIEHIPI